MAILSFWTSEFLGETVCSTILTKKSKNKSIPSGLIIAVTQKNFFGRFHPSVQDIFCYITYTFKRTSHCYLDLKFHNVSPF